MRTPSPEVAARRRRERRIGSWLFALLLALLAALAVVQADFDPAFYAPPVSVEGRAKPEAASAFAGWTPPGFAPVAPAEAFDATTLYEKIDGKADLYLSAGFQGLTCRRFAATDAPELGFEACVYQMGAPDAAFSVFSRQRRPGDPVADLGETSCATSNALFAARGPAYLEVISADEGERTRAARLAFAVAWKAASAGEPVAAERAPFPAQGRVDGSVRLLKDSVFGFARLDNVYTAEYDDKGDAATAFWTERATADEARELGQAFVAHLLASGAARAEALVPDATTLDALGSFEVVCVRDRYVTGVHQADTVELARRLAMAMCTATAGEGSP